MFHFKFCRRGQQDPIDFFTTLSSGENDDRKKFPTEEKEALLEPFNLVLQSWMFCNKDENHRSASGGRTHRFVDISKPENTEGLQLEIEDFFHGGVPVIGWRCPQSGIVNDIN